MKKYKNNFNETIYNLLKLQCEVVGVDIDKLDLDEVLLESDPRDCGKKCFYELYEWTQEQEEEYKEKFVEYLQSNAKARREIGCLRKSKKYILERVWPYWCLQFTFKTKKGEK